VLDEGLVVVAEGEGHQRIGLFVDDLLGQQQVVIKSLEANYGHVEGVSGQRFSATLRGSHPGHSGSHPRDVDARGGLTVTDQRGNTTMSSNAPVKNGKGPGEESHQVLTSFWATKRTAWTFCVYRKSAVGLP